ncbi:MAG: methyltransferase [Muribaculaceae bacterium]|nr:methyltransferase [Muribaculaceae bacterium]
MRENIFRFKQFCVINKNSAMKVGTDGVLLGAWCDVSDRSQRILDIGAGTGLLSLMMAQRAINAYIVGIEIDADAYGEACDNVAGSAWSDRIEMRNIDFTNFIVGDNEKFDIIISNPPFFDNGILSNDSSRAMARHSFSLSLDLLIERVAKLLTKEGKFSFIYPASSIDKIRNLAVKNNLFISRITMVRPTKDILPKRVLCELSISNCPVLENELVIEEGRHIYTQDYISLTRDFYLKM